MLRSSRGWRRVRLVGSADRDPVPAQHSGRADACSPAHHSRVLVRSLTRPSPVPPGGRLSCAASSGCLLLPGANGTESRLSCEPPRGRLDAGDLDLRGSTCRIERDGGAGRGESLFGASSGDRARARHAEPGRGRPRRRPRAACVCRHAQVPATARLKASKIATDVVTVIMEPPVPAACAALRQGMASPAWWPGDRGATTAGTVRPPNPGMGRTHATGRCDRPVAWLS